jgi:pimeloyl-ACP methyl ester carboxylesterase
MPAFKARNQYYRPAPAFSTRSTMTTSMKASRSEFLGIRGLRYHVRHWGSADAPKLFLLHGWMDVSASFQFMVDYLQKDWHVIAPDWRGFGLTERAHADTYWFADYIGDLDAILHHYAPDEAVRLVGHSMGANVSTSYAGVRPQRIERLVNLEGVGMAGSRAEQAPRRIEKWLDELRAPPTMRSYASPAEVAARLQKTNPRLTDERAAFLSTHWAGETAPGQWEILGDPAHKGISPHLYRLDEVLACWARITAPTLYIEATETDMARWMGAKDSARLEIDRRIATIPNVTTRMVENAGHMLHHDQPQVLARLIEDFLG